MAKSLFITYDGLTDPLGQSQILPYLTGLTQKGHNITILSCEKNDRFEKNRTLIEEICQMHSIKWVPLFFHTTPPVLAKYYDLYQLNTTAFRLYKQEEYDIIHCRSYLSAGIGRKLKQKFNARYLFDMRGFWVDERVDGGLWNLKFPFFRLAYKIWKKKEGMLIQDADHIISLTEVGKKEIESWPAYKKETSITVIPCSADMELFTVTSQDQKKAARLTLGISDNTFVLSYLGSLGTWYLLDEMLLFFKKVKEVISDTRFLILTPDFSEIVYQKASEMGLHKDDFIIRFAKRMEVPSLMKASDISVSFIKPAYSKIASSPTKLGELLAMGIPVICNDIGDVDQIVTMSGGGIVLKDFSTVQLQSAIDYIQSIGLLNPNVIRNRIMEYYSLHEAVTKYHLVYESFFSKSKIH